MSEVIGDAMNMRIARLLDVFRVTHTGGEVHYDGENYVNDLNACRVMLATLKRTQQMRFGEQLNIVVKAFDNDYYEGWMAEDGCFGDGMFALANASAAQLCEAFVETVDGD